MSRFVKVSKLSSDDSSKLKNYWAELWGNDYANSIVKDYKTATSENKEKKEDK